LFFAFILNMNSLSSAFFLFYKITRFFCSIEMLYSQQLLSFTLGKTCGYSDVHVKSSKNIIFSVTIIALSLRCCLQICIKSFFLLYFPWRFPLNLISVIVGPSHWPMPAFFVLFTKNFVQQAFFSSFFRGYSNKGFENFVFSTTHMCQKLIFWVVS